MTFLLCLLVFVVGFLLGSWTGKRQGAARAVMAEIARLHHADSIALSQAPECVGCGRPANPVKFHDGRYLCSACKAAA